MRSGVCGAVSGRYIEIFTQLKSGGGATLPDTLSRRRQGRVSPPRCTCRRARSSRRAAAGGALASPVVSLARRRRQSWGTCNARRRSARALAAACRYSAAQTAEAATARSTHILPKMRHPLEACEGSCPLPRHDRGARLSAPRGATPREPANRMPQGRPCTAAYPRAPHPLAAHPLAAHPRAPHLLCAPRQSRHPGVVWCGPCAACCDSNLPVRRLRPRAMATAAGGTRTSMHGAEWRGRRANHG